jgi:sensor histidine kinase regulating citrate/malate metabolism
MATKKKTDLSAALTGLILGVVTLFLLLTTIVMMTNARYRGKEAAETPAPAAASATANHE